MTFGTVIPVISQLAITRMLHRRYLRGDLSADEWERRRRQPMHFGGPINLRPYMDPEWQSKGGATEVALAIDYYECTLPFMPTPFGSRRDEGVRRDHLGAPPFAALMSPARFFYRGWLCRQQLRMIMANPLAMDIAAARQPTYVHRKRVMATHWLAEKKGEPLPDLPVPVQARDAAPADCVFANGLSSVGQVRTFPLSSTLVWSPNSHHMCRCRSSSLQTILFLKATRSRYALHAPRIPSSAISPKPHLSFLPQLPLMQTRYSGSPMRRRSFTAVRRSSSWATAPSVGSSVSGSLSTGTCTRPRTLRSSSKNVDWRPSIIWVRLQCLRENCRVKCR